MEKINTTTKYKIGNTTYVVNIVFDETSKETISDIVRRMIERDAEKEAA